MAESRSLKLFFNSIKSERTRITYEYNLKRFVKFYKLKSIEAILEIESRKLQEMIEDYIMQRKSNGLSTSMLNSEVSALETLSVTNDVLVNWKKIRKLFPEQKKPTGEMAWSTEDIQDMLSVTSSLRNKAVIYFFASTGVREGAIPDLKLKHLMEMPMGCKSVTVYDGTKEEYLTFLTPEASSALDNYFEKRRSDGEHMTLESPVFRQVYSIGMAKAKPITTDSLAGLIESILDKANLRSEKREGRYKQQRFHAFRKRFNTILKLNREINVNLIEKLMGHKRGLDGSYLKPTKEELFSEFKKGIADLTIDSSERILAEKKKIEIERTELENLKLQMSEQAENLKQTQIELEEAKKEFTRIKVASEDPNQVS